MPLVPLDLPERLTAAGLDVKVIAGWETRGRAADHRALVMHHTASRLTQDELSVTAGHVHGSGKVPGPVCNLSVGRSCTVYLVARNTANHAGQINFTPRDEAIAGAARLVSAASRGLRTDDGSDNAHLFGIEVTNDGVGEPWSAGLVDASATTAAVVLDSLGLTPGHLTEHRCLTKRKIDTRQGAFGADAPPVDWHGAVAARWPGGLGVERAADPPAEEVSDMALIPSFVGPIVDGDLRGRWPAAAIEGQRLLLFNGLDVAIDPLEPMGWTKSRTGPACIAITAPGPVGQLLGVAELPGERRSLVVLARDGGTFTLPHLARPDLGVP